MNVDALGFATFGFFCSALVAFGLAGAVFAALGFSAFGFPAVCFSALGFCAFGFPVVCFSALGSCALAVTVMPVIAAARHRPPIRLREMRKREGRFVDMIYVIRSFRSCVLGTGRRGWRLHAVRCLRRRDEAAKVGQAAARGRV